MSMRLADQKGLVSSLSKALTMLEMRSSNSTATTGKAELSRFEKTDMPILQVDSRVAKEAMGEASVLEVATVVAMV